MSAAVSLRLREITERGEQRRRRVAEIRRESCALWAAARELRTQYPPQGWSRRDAALPRATAAMSGEGARPEPDAAPGDGGVLAQVRRLLHEVDSRELECWNEEDTLILVCLRGALMAAARKGYVLGEVHDILEALKPPEMER